MPCPSIATWARNIAATLYALKDMPTTNTPRDHLPLHNQPTKKKLMGMSASNTVRVGAGTGCPAVH
jgi:hypothetical protein